VNSVIANKHGFLHVGGHLASNRLEPGQLSNAAYRPPLPYRLLDLRRECQRIRQRAFPPHQTARHLVDRHNFRDGDAAIHRGNDFVVILDI